MKSVVPTIIIQPFNKKKSLYPLCRNLSYFCRDMVLRRKTHVPTTNEPFKKSAKATRFK